MRLHTCDYASTHTYARVPPECGAARARRASRTSIDGVLDAGGAVVAMAAAAATAAVQLAGVRVVETAVAEKEVATAAARVVVS